jgi:alkaline phosphatase
MRLKTILFFVAITFIATAQKKPKNVVFIIGDGMGLAHVHAAMVVKGNDSSFEQFQYIGFSKTHSANNFTTDSGAGGTALACGVKTKNGMIGMTADSIAVESIMRVAERNGLSTGIVATCNITHATPASYFAHQVSRKMYEEIAADFLKTDIDVFIGGGRNEFEKRSDNRNLTNELKNKGYTIAYTLEQAKQVKTGKLAAMLSDDNISLYPELAAMLNDGHVPPYPQRGEMLPEASLIALDILDNNKKGFFLMIEGSQIDWASHDNNASQVIKEVIDLDNTIGKVLEFAKKNKNTLVIVTSDHETGGMAIGGGNIEMKRVSLKFNSENHSGVLVPVFAYGPGAENFIGFMDNTSFKSKLIQLLKLKN